MKPLALLVGLLVAIMMLPLLVAGIIVGAFLPASTLAINCTGPVAVVTGAWRPPLLSAYTVTSEWGMRKHPVDGGVRRHTGIDLIATGDQTVVAANGGTVTWAGPEGAFGNSVKVDHGGGITTRYAHLASIAVTDGQAVEAGTPLGVQGATGKVTGPHLHFEVIRDAADIDPAVFMKNHAAPLDGRQVTTTAGADQLGPDAQAGIGFALPYPGEPRKHSIDTPATPIPDDIKALYTAAASAYAVPWTLLAGIGMIETQHGANTATSTAGAQGLMQFMPATFAAYGVDGNGDGIVDILNPADSIYSAANYLTASGVTRGEQGVREALFAYNHADWYVNDVLAYADTYGDALVLGGVEDCGPGTGTGNPNLPDLAGDRVETVMTWAAGQVGDAYVFGGTGPDAWDCSGFTQAAFAQVGITIPRTAGAQRDWLAAGNGYQVQPGQERPGDLIFWDSFLGPNQIGHVAIVGDPTTQTTIDARNSQLGVGRHAYTADGKTIYEIWRVGDVHAP